MNGILCALCRGCVLLGVLVVSATAVETPNRTPVDDATFALIADRFAYDRELPLEAQTLGDWPYRQPYVTEKVQFVSIHRQVVPALFTHPKDLENGPVPAILLLHGMNGIWGKYEDWAREWMDLLSRAGWCVMVADHPGFGERMRPGQRPYWELPPFAFRDHVIQSVTDQRRALDYLFTRPEVDTTRVALMGGSMGGYYGTLVAGLEDRFACVVLTVTSAWPEGATDDPLLRFAHTLNFAPRISAPVFMVNAKGDKPEAGQELFDHMPQPKQQIWFEHSHYMPPHEFNKEILDYLHGQLD